MSPDTPIRRKPGRSSIVATHPQREQIEAACAAGVSLRRIAGRFSVGLMSVHRHWHSLPAEHRATLTAAVAHQDAERWRMVSAGLAALARRHPNARADIVDLAHCISLSVPTSREDSAHAA